MKLTPVENLVYYTKLKETEVIARLNSVLEGNVSVNPEITNKYKGNVAAEGFKIKRVISYRNSFLPLVIGRFEKDFQGTTIHIKMRMTILAIIFTLVWFAIMTASVIILSLKSIKDDEFKVFIIAMPVMLIVACAIVIGAFKFETKKTKKDLRALLEMRSGSGN